jgi:hypothetical protein
VKDVRMLLIECNKDREEGIPGKDGRRNRNEVNKD